MGYRTIAGVDTGYLKDIVQPKKTGVKRGTNRFASTSFTIADGFFGLVSCFKFEKNVTTFRA
jgi:hypothetical protein